MQPTSIRLSIPDSIDPTRLMGPADANLRRVEAAFEALVSVRGNQVLVSGSAEHRVVYALDLSCCSEIMYTAFS